MRGPEVVVSKPDSASARRRCADRSGKIRGPPAFRTAMTRFARALLALALAASAASASATTYVTVGGQFDLPEGFRQLDRKDDDGSGLYVFGRTADDRPRAVFIVTIVRVANPDDAVAAADQRETAVRMANPADPSLTAADAEPVNIGGAPGARYATTLPNGLLSTGYAVDHGDLRLVALLKTPPGADYRKDTARFAAALENFAWALRVPAAPATAPVAPAAPAMPSAEPTGT